MSDEFFIVPFVVRAAGTDVPPEQIQAAINSICQQVTADLNLIVSGGFPQTNVDITGGTITGVTGATQGRLDNSLLLATDAFVNQQGASAVATVLFANVTGGVYNQATLGSGLTVVVFATGGVITSSLTISNPGSGYAVGDLVAVAAGNSDAVLRVTGVSGSGVTSVGIAYGGTGYSTGIVATAMAVPPGRRAVVFTGVLTSNLTFIIQNGTYLTASREVEFINNTTGGFTITVFLSNGAGGHTGNGVVLPQGTNDSSALAVYTDGQNDVWLANTPLGIGAIPASGGSINNVPIGQTTPAAGAFTTLTATTPVAVSSGGTGRATLTTHGVLIGEGAAAINQTAVGLTGQVLIGSTGADPAFGNNPVLNGGTIDNTVIGGTTPAAVSSTGGALNGTLGATTPNTVSATNIAASGAITPSQTNGIVGTTAANNANAGSVGEYVSANASGVSLTSNTPANVTSISLTAGDWDVAGQLVIVAAAGTVLTMAQAGVNTASATIPTVVSGLGVSILTGTLGTATDPALSVMPTRISIAATTTVFLVAEATFTVSTCTTNGFIRARRVR